MESYKPSTERNTYIGFIISELECAHILVASLLTSPKLIVLSQSLPLSRFWYSRVAADCSGIWLFHIGFSGLEIMQTKVTTVIVNATKQGLTMKIGNRNELTSVKVGGEYRMQVDVNWTYQEFVLQDKCDEENQVFINSDDCCDYERITIREIDGKFDVQRDLRKQYCDASATQERTSVGRWKLWLCRFV